MNDLKERILDFCFYCSCSRRKFAQLVNISPNTLYRFLNNPNVELKKTKAQEINKYLNDRGFWSKRILQNLERTNKNEH